MGTITIDVDRYLSDDEEYKERIMEDEDFKRVIDDWSRTLLTTFYLEIVAKHGVDRARILKEMLLECEGYEDLGPDYEIADLLAGRLTVGGSHCSPRPFENKRDGEDGE